MGKAQNRESGKKGEAMASAYLEEKGYIIAHRNWFGAGHEIDIIAKYNRRWIFIEVKLRNSGAFGWPEQAVNAAKQKRIVQAANEFIFQNSIDDEIRFDIVSILSSGGKTEIYHIEDAFVP